VAEKKKVIVKVAKLRILKPAGDMNWPELGEMLRTVRYRVFRLANLAVSEAYLNFHAFRSGKSKEFKRETYGTLSRRLREMLIQEEVKQEDLNRYSSTGAVPDTVGGALAQYKIRGITSPSKWRQVVRGQVALPTFRADMAIPIRCDKQHQRRLERTESGEVELDLMICKKPYPRVVLGTRNLSGSQQAILERLLDNAENSEDGYRQRLFEVKQDRQTKKWWLYVTYDFESSPGTKPHPDVVVGVDLGVSVPMYVAISNGHARLGRRQFQALGNRIRALQNQVDARRRSIQRGGRLNISHSSARTGHGRRRKLQPTEKLMSRIDKAYSTLNHQLSASVVDFAKNHGAGTIQIENLDGLREQLTGTFIGARWRYHQLQEFLEYKAAEVGITIRQINPRYTSRRCSECGYIHAGFDRAYRDAHRSEAAVAKFVCPQCGYDADPDYNAARNIATVDIEDRIRLQCESQGLDYDGL
jgi:IS605 OrfB family transposase